MEQAIELSALAKLFIAIVVAGAGVLMSTIATLQVWILKELHDSGKKRHAQQATLDCMGAELVKIDNKLETFQERLNGFEDRCNEIILRNSEKKRV